MVDHINFETDINGNATWACDNEKATKPKINQNSLPDIIFVGVFGEIASTNALSDIAGENGLHHSTRCLHTCFQKENVVLQRQVHVYL